VTIGKGVVRGQQKFVKFHRKKAAVRRYLPFYPVVYLLCPYPPFLPCRRRPWSCRRVPFCPMTSFPVSFPCPYPRWRPSECADPKFPRHLDSNHSVTCTFFWCCPDPPEGARKLFEAVRAASIVLPSCRIARSYKYPDLCEISKRTVESAAVLRSLEGRTARSE
jgi:hypothetical protein